MALHKGVGTVLRLEGGIHSHCCDYQLFSSYLMNFVLHTMLDAAGELVLRVHYKSMKCDASFSQGSVSTIFR